MLKQALWLSMGIGVSSACDSQPARTAPVLSELRESPLVAADEQPVACRRGDAGIWRGDASVLDPEDHTGAPRLRGITSITGTLDLFASEHALVDLACLRTVGGLYITRIGNTPRARSLRGLERLQSVQGPLSIDDTSALEGVSFDGLSNLESVAGDLELRGPGLPLANLNGLASLRWIAGRLVIGGYDLGSFWGLERLRSVGGDLVVETANALTSLAALGNLTEIAGELELRGTGSGSRLRDLSGLERLERLGGLALSGLDSLQSLSGLPKFTRLPGGVQLADLRALRSIDTLSALTRTGGVLELSDLPQLTRLTALSRIEQTAGLTLSHLTNITQLTSLSQLTRVAGDVFIVANDALGSLDGLRGLSAVDGSFALRDGVVKSVAGLRKLRTIGETLYLWNTPVSSLDGLQGLRSLRALYIEQSALGSLAGLDNLSALQNLTLTRNPALTRIDALRSLTGIPGGIQIADDPKLESLDGLQHVTRTATLSLQALPAITSLAALAALESVDDAYFGIYELAQLRSLAGLEALETVYGLAIAGNPLLADITALSALSSAVDLNIYENPSLPSCQATALAERLQLACTCPPRTRPACPSCSGIEYCTCESRCACSGNDDAATCLR